MGKLNDFKSLYKILTPIKNSLSYRLTYIYKFVLEKSNFKTIDKPKFEVNLVMMVGINYISLAKFCLLTISKKWSFLPNLFIYSDGTITLQEIKDNLQFWQGNVSCRYWNDCIGFHTKKNRTQLVHYANQQPFGKKLALILFHAAQHPTLWLDSDILFHGDFTTYIPEILNDEFICGGSEDWATVYDTFLVKNKLAELNKFEKFNAGLLLVNGKNIYEDFNLEAILWCVKDNYNFFTEQTIFAYLAKHSLGIIWRNDVIKNAMDDRQKIKPTMPFTIGRHYTSNVRHLFWRDLLFSLYIYR